MPRSRELMIGGAAAIAQVINLLTNPDFEAAGAVVPVRTNRYTNPRNIGTPVSGRAPGLAAYSSGAPTGTYAVSGEIQQLTVTAMAAGVGTERFGVAATVALGSLYPANTPVTVSMDTSVVALPAGVRPRIYADIQDSTASNATRAHWDAFFDATTGRISGTGIVNGPADTVRLYVWFENNNAGAAFSGTATVGFTKTMVEANYAAPYIDGGTQPILRTNLMASVSRRPSAWSNAAGVSITPVTDSRFLSAPAVRGYPSGNSWTSFGGVTANVGETHTVSFRHTAPLGGLPIGGYASFGGSNPPAGTTTQGVIDNGDGTFTSWATRVFTAAGSYSFALNATIATAGTMIIGDPMTTLTATPGQFFDGATVRAGFIYTWLGAANSSTATEIDADLSVSWQGTANNSVSQLTGIGVPGSASTGAIAFIRSSRWKASGIYSGRMIATSATTSISYASYTITGGAINGGTLVVTSYQEAPITGSSWAMLGKLYTNPSSTTYVSAQRPNAAGTFEHRLSYGTGQSNFILSHGGTLGSPDIWYDLALLVADPFYTGSAFSGSSQSKDGVAYRWSGGVDASTSIKETMTVSGGLQLNDPQGRWWIAGATPPRTPAARRHVALPLPGRDGEYPMSREPRNTGSYGLVMHFQGINASGGFDAATADRNLSKVLAAMSGEFLMIETLYSAAGNPLIRQTFGQLLNGVSPTKKPKLHVLEVTMPISLTDGRWQTPGVTQVTQTLTTSPAPMYFFELAGVDAETDDIIIRLSNKNNTGKVTVFGGEYNARAGGAFGTRTGISYAATIPAGSYVFIDVKNFVAKQGTSATDWAMAGGTDVTANLDYPPSGKLELSPLYLPTLDTTSYVAMIQAEAAATSAALTIQVRGTYQ